MNKHQFWALVNATLPSNGYSLAPLVTPVQRPVAGRTKQTFINTHSSDGTSTFGVYRSRHQIFPGWDCTGQFRVWYANRCSESNGFNSITVSAEYEYPANSGNWTSLTFGGMASITMAASSADQGSDPITVSMAGGTYLRIRTHVSVASSGMKWPSLDSIGLAAANGEGSAVSTSSAPADPANLDTTEFYGPVAITGLSRAPYAVGIFSDSIGNGAYDDHTLDTIGFFQRSLAPTVPVINLSTSGETSIGFVNTHTKRMALAVQLGLTHANVAYGTNDLTSGLSTLQGNLTTIYTLLKAQGWRVSGAPILTKTTSSDSWATTTNQTPQTGAEVGGIADQVNAWMQGLVGTTLLHFIDTRTGWQNASNHIIGTGTAFGCTPDGLHPSVSSNINIAATLTAAQQISF